MTKEVEARYLEREDTNDLPNELEITSRTAPETLIQTVTFKITLNGKEYIENRKVTDEQRHHFDLSEELKSFCSRIAAQEGVSQKEVLSLKAINHD
jgi:hypothetical protein